jgi:lipopolysaccharide transport system permease protein
MAESGPEREVAAEHVLHIAPSRGWGFPNLRELWASRELVYFLTWRDVKVRYKQALLGIAWVVLQPVATVAVFSLFFGRLLGVPSGGVPYPVFAFAGLLPWTYFSASLTRASSSLVGSANMITKVYFPRLAIPLSAVLGGLVDAAVSLAVLLGTMLLFHVPITLAVLWALPMLLLAAVTALAFGLWLGSLNVRYRDIGHIVPFVVQIWMYVTPVIYATTLIPERLRFLLGLNPMTVVVEGFRWAILQQAAPAAEIPTWIFGVSLALVVVVLVTGMLYFERVQRTFADVV